MFYIKEAFRRCIKGILGLCTYSSIYDQLLEEIDVLRPKIILEFGTNDSINPAPLSKSAS